MMRRTLLAILISTSFVFAGCIAGEDGVDPSAKGKAGQDHEAAAAANNTTVELGEFCTEESTCDFWDDDLHEYVLYEVDTYILDILIVPSASPGLQGDTAAIRQSVEAWTAGVKELGADWFATNFTTNVYVLGTDVPPEEAIQDPEIIVVAAEYNPFVLFGIGYQSPADVCRNRGGSLAEEAHHAHHGMEMFVADCAEGGKTCVALNTNFLLGGVQRMYDLVSHEVGHCLGGGHVGDALDFNAKTVPLADIMSYQYNETQVHCVSSLNVRVLEGVYAPLLGRDEGEWLAADSFYTMAPADYHQVTCANP